MSYLFTKGLPPQQQSAYDRAGAFDSKIEQDAYLDGSQDMYNELILIIDKLQEENRIMREALEFLRDNRVHDSRVTTIAREALEEVK